MKFDVSMEEAETLYHSVRETKAASHSNICDCYNDDDIVFHCALFICAHRLEHRLQKLLEVE